MTDNVRPDAGDEREAASSGLLISTDPLRQDAAGHRLSAGDGGGDSDGSALDNYVGQRPTVIEVGDGDSDADDSDGGDSDDDDDDTDGDDGDIDDSDAGDGDADDSDGDS